MKISVFDSNNGKFSNVLRFHWQKLGHDVSYSPVWDPRVSQDSETIFFDWADANVSRASDPNHEDYAKYNVPYAKGKNIICRCNDIDMWVDNLLNIKPNFVNHLVFGADHIMREAIRKNQIPEGAQVHLIPYGIDIERFTLKV